MSTAAIVAFISQVADAALRIFGEYVDMVENSACSTLVLSHILTFAVCWDEASLDGLPHSYNTRVERYVILMILYPKEKLAAGVYVRNTYMVGKVTQTPNTKMVETV